MNEAFLIERIKHSLKLLEEEKITINDLIERLKIEIDAYEKRILE